MRSSRPTCTIALGSLALYLTSSNGAAQTTTAALADARNTAARFELTEQTISAWSGHILLDASETSWESIPWIATFKDGLIRADAAGRPLLLWVMNGHPLGCT